MRTIVSLSICSMGHVGHLNLDPFLANRLTLDLSTAWPHLSRTGGFSGVLCTSLRRNTDGGGGGRAVGGKVTAMIHVSR